MRIIERLIGLVAPAHKIGTRTYAVAAMRNWASSAGFRAKLVAAENFSEVLSVLTQKIEKVELFVHITGLLRNLIADEANLDLLVERKIHLLLFGAIDAFPESADLAFNCFRILTKASDRDSVRSDLLEKYCASGVVGRLLMLIQSNKNNPQILTRISYVFSDFAAWEPDVLTASGKHTGLGVLSEYLQIVLFIEHSLSGDVTISSNPQPGPSSSESSMNLGRPLIGRNPVSK
jgi:hypothetical protein